MQAKTPSTSAAGAQARRRGSGVGGGGSPERMLEPRAGRSRADGGYGDTVRAMPDVIWSDRPSSRDPVLVCAFKGWNDAGEAASAALDFLVEQLRRPTSSPRIDPEEFYDFTAVRPDRAR